MSAPTALTKHDIALVQEDWDKVEQIGPQAATLLYDRLFELAPEARELFPADLEHQKVKLINMFGAAISGLSQLEVLMPIIRLLGRKHVRFGVKNEDYATVGDALIWTLRRGLGTEFGPEHEAAWLKVYGYLAEAMKAPA